MSQEIPTIYELIIDNRKIEQALREWKQQYPESSPQAHQFVDSLIEMLNQHEPLLRQEESRQDKRKRSHARKTKG